MSTTRTASAFHLDRLDAMPGADRPAIASTLTALLTGFVTRDADRLADVYAEDADWVNAFGSVKRGAAEIVEYLRGLFADANFDEGQLVAPPASTLRRLSDDIALVSTRLQLRGRARRWRRHRAPRQPLPARAPAPGGRRMADHLRDVHGCAFGAQLRWPFLIRAQRRAPSTQRHGPEHRFAAHCPGHPGTATSLGAQSSL